MIRTLPAIFSQRDPQWKDIPLGDSRTITIGSSGCYITSMAIVANYYNKQTTPAELNQYLKDNNLYVSATQGGDKDLIGGDDTLQKVYPEIVFQGDHFFPDATPTSAAVPADLNLLHSLMDDPTVLVILQVDMGKGNSHFVVCMGCNGTTTIADPWTGTQVDFATVYGNPSEKILKFIVFKGNPASSAATTTTATTTDQATIDQLRTDRDLNYNCFQEVTSSLGVTVDPNDKQGTVQKAKEKVDSYTHQIAQLTQERNECKDQVTALTVQVKELNTSNSNVGTLYAQKCKEDATAIENGMRATSQLSQIHERVEKLLACLAIKTTYQSDGDAINAAINTLIKLDEGKTQTAQSHLQEIIKHLEANGLNQWLQTQRIAGVDGETFLSDPQLSQKVSAFMTELFTELKTLNDAQKQATPVIQKIETQAAQVVSNLAKAKKSGFFSRFGKWAVSQVLTQS